MSPAWLGEVPELALGNPGHGGFCVARHEGRVVFVRHGLPGERVRARITEDRGGSFCRADVVEVLTPSADRIEAVCPVSGPGGAGCCDLSHATLPAQRAWKASVLAEQLHRIAKLDHDVDVQPVDLGEQNDGGGWRTRVGLIVDADGRAGAHGYRTGEVITDLRCPQPVVGALAGIAERRWTPGTELRVVVDGDGVRHIVALAAPQLSAAARADRGRRGAAARRAASAAPRREDVLDGTGRAHEHVGGRRWEVAATGFWQAHRGAPAAYSDIVAQWAQAEPGDLALDLYSGVGVFAARLAEQVGSAGTVMGAESSRSAVADGVAALGDLPQVRLQTARTEDVLAQTHGRASVAVLDPPRAGAGKAVIAAVAAREIPRVIHIGCDPAAFARDVSLYREHGYQLAELKAFDAFPLTHHVEAVGLLVRN